MSELNTLFSLHYLKSTAHDRTTIFNKANPKISSTESFKSYPATDTVKLVTNWSLDEARITPLIQRRRSVRSYDTKPIPLPDLSFMLWAGQGITAKSGDHFLRAAPSAGALYPIETYCAVLNVEGVEQGLYHLDVKNFQLELLQSGNFGPAIMKACLGQTFIQTAGVVFIWTAIFRRNFQKFGDRGLRYVLFDAGHICQNTLLAIEAAGCGGCPVATFFDSELNGLLEIDGNEEAVVYLATAGTRK